MFEIVQGSTYYRGGGAMIRTIRELRRAADAHLRGEEIERDEEGRALLTVTVRDDEEFLSDLSGRRAVVSSAVGEFLERQALAVSPGEPLALHVESDCIDEEERPVYVEALRERYRLLYREKRRELKRNAWYAALLAAAGVAWLLVTVLLSHVMKNAVLFEVIDIVAWVFLWEAADLFFLERRLLRGERDRCLCFLDMPVRFAPISSGRAKLGRKKP